MGSSSIFFIYLTLTFNSLHMNKSTKRCIKAKRGEINVSYILTNTFEILSLEETNDFFYKGV